MLHVVPPPPMEGTKRGSSLGSIWGWLGFSSSLRMSIYTWSKCILEQLHINRSSMYWTHTYY